MDQPKNLSVSVQTSSGTDIMKKKKRVLRDIVENVMSALDRRSAEGLDFSGDDTSDTSEENVTSIPHAKVQDFPPPPNYPAENDGPNLILGYSQSPVDMACVEHWLTLAEEGKAYTEKLMTEVPVKPKGGQMMLYKCNRKHDLDHHRDQYTGFRNNASTQGKQNNPVLKKYFKLLDRDGNTKNFEKATYERKCSAEKPDKVVLIHYTGDESEYDERCHGNSKSGKNYTASKKTALLEIGREISETGKGSQSFYEKLIKKAAQRDDFREREAVVAPRDRKQVENVKQDIEDKRRLLRCDIFSVIEMGRNETLGRFIMRHVVNPYDLIIMAEPAGLRFAENLLSCAKADPELPQYLCYDTTFNLADAYVSVLVMRNTYVQDNPLFPLAFLIHERKLEIVHREFFREICDSVGLEDLVSSVPIVFDRERGISNAVQRILPQIKYIFCSNHIIRDVKYWVKKAGGKQDDLKVLRGHVRHMLECESPEEFDEYYSNVSPMWSQGFKDYFVNELLDDVKHRAAKLYTKQFAAFKDKCATNNASETFNFMIKNRNEWRELRVDSLIMSLFNLQLSLLQEFERAFHSAGIGQYVLKPQYKNFKCPVEMPAYMTWTESKFLATFKEGVYKPQCNIEKETNYMQSRSSLAKLTCEQNLVSLDSRAGVFVVTGVYNGKRVIVDRKDNGMLECSCKSTGYCYHKLAVLYSLKVDVSEDKDSYSLSILRKKGRGGKRTGRKGPNVDDFVNNVEPAPDSDLAKLRSHSPNSEGDSTGDGNNSNTAVVSQPESSTEEVMITSEGQRSDDDDSFQAIHHYSNNQFIEPNDELAIPRTSITGSRSLSVVVDTPEFILFSGAPHNIPRSWTQNSTYQCLAPKQWLAEDIVNDMTRLLIKSLQLDEAVAFLNTHEFNVVRSGSMSKYVTEALRCQGINSDVLLINICMNSHFLFAVALYRHKKIVIVDSLKGVVAAADIYKTLLLIVAATYFVGFVNFEPEEWEIITETQLASQSNGFDCGVFAIYNQYEMLRRQPFPKELPPSEKLRKWILHCLHSKEAKGSILIHRGKKVKRLIPRHRSQVEDLLESLSIPDAMLMCKSGSSIMQITEELNVCRRGWGTCAHDGCKANFSDITYVMCTYCREWFHLGPCIPHEEAKEDYYLCVKCTMYRISFSEN